MFYFLVIPNILFVFYIPVFFHSFFFFVYSMEVHEQDRYLPIANIGRIMKRSIPPTAKISKEAKECVQECVSEFIAFVTSE